MKYYQRLLAATSLSTASLAAGMPASDAPASAPQASHASAVMSAEQTRIADAVNKDGLTFDRFATRESDTEYFRLLDEVQQAAQKQLPNWKQPKVKHIVYVKNVSNGSSSFAYYPLKGESTDGVLIVNAGSKPQGTEQSKFAIAHELGHGLIIKNGESWEQLFALTNQSPCFGDSKLAAYGTALKEFVYKQPGLNDEQKARAFSNALYAQLQEIISDKIGIIITRKPEEAQALFKNEGDIPTNFEAQLGLNRIFQALSPRENRPSESERTVEAISNMVHQPLPNRLDTLTLPENCPDPASTNRRTPGNARTR